MNPIRRAYAAQRQISFRRDMHHNTREFARDVSWVIVAWTIVSALLVSGIIG